MSIVKRFLVPTGILKVGKPVWCGFFFQNQYRVLHKKHLLLYMYADLLKKNDLGN